MKKLILFALPIVILSFAGCKKAGEKTKEIIDEIIAGYWESVDEMVIEVKEDEAVVVEFGSSPLGTNKSVFNTGDPFIKNLSRTDANSWTGDVLQPVFDTDDKLVSITYQPATLTTEDNATDRTLVVPDAPAEYRSWNPVYNYTPPVCDTTSQVVVDNNNFATLYENGAEVITFTATRVRCGYRRRTVLNKPCFYRIATDNLYSGYHKIELYFGTKPEAGKSYNITDEMLQFTPEDEVYVVWDSGRFKDGVITVTSEGGKLKIKADHLSFSNSNNSYSFEIYGN